ncbi:putative LEAF RUST 10 DISEASE-RESISTANCE LOCUS RECEPTOR-LIKE PROTEIN KINASE-like 2.7 [Cocos nucifera]|nr:putative LEAF RUST 10 DISEASE-RESISTANCE LOCUS RECEPTOR-LIKE PROTEIN KINASE-like 2.7 [Cocos nucifera]
MHPPSLFMPFHHLLTFLFFLKLSWLPVSFSESSYYYRYENCAPIKYACGNIKFNLSYPFQVNGRPGYCGHPGYFLSCGNNNTTLMIDINKKEYQVKDIDNLNHLLTVVDQSLISQSCPDPYENMTIDLLLFDYSDRDQNVTLYVNCTSLSSVPTLYDIGCSLDVTGQQHSYYRLDNTSFVDVLGKCSSTVLVPMSSTAADRLVDGNMSFGSALKEGILLQSKGSFSFFFFLISSLLREGLVFAANPRAEDCEPKNCGNGLNISYPFWLRGQQLSYCGYPSFVVTCKSSVPVLKLLGHDFRIEQIFYDSRSVLVTQTDFLGSDCPFPYYNLTLSRSLFPVNSANKILFFLFNCSEGLCNHKEIPCRNAVTRAYLVGVFSLSDRPSF